MISRFHNFNRLLKECELPRQFTFPFHYVPNALCIEAAEIVKQYLATRLDWAEELQHGKMFGVLVAKSSHNEIGFFAAYSGNIAHCNNHDYFVPAIYDLLNPEGEFCQGEKEISALNAIIRDKEQSANLATARAALNQAQNEVDAKIAAHKSLMQAEKSERDALRSSQPQLVTAEMIKRSQFMKAELKRLKKSCDDRLAPLRASVSSLEQEIADLKQRRASMSAKLQNRIFQLFKVNNVLGEQSDLLQLFTSSPQGTPPAGAGECAAPKLLQYAIANHFTPLAIAEFWWGNSPTDEVRHHGHFYPACRSKCLHILPFMMRGINVEPNPLATMTTAEIEVLYDDQWLSVVNKPAGLQTIPGKLTTDSLLTRYQRQFPQANGPLIVHRLDMATSGLVIIAKTKEVHKSLQSSFADHRISKRYIALLNGSLAADKQEGTITLPLRANILDRPRQMVDFELGKKAITQYRVLSTRNGITQIELSPLTGRTHQLRVHCSHSLGLNTPIVGDDIYGTHDKRLYLHAAHLQFRHPVTGETITVQSKPEF